MATLEQSIDVDVPIEVAREQWAHFVKWVLVGNYKFACDAFSCARAADSEIVDFRALEPERTRVVVTLPHDEEAGGDSTARHALLANHLYQDLKRFRQYLAEHANSRSKRADGPESPQASEGHALLFDKSRPEQASRGD